MLLSLIASTLAVAQDDETKGTELEVTQPGQVAGLRGDLVVIIKRDGTLRLANKPVYDNELLNAFKNAPDNARVIIQADAQTGYGRVSQILDMAKAQGITRIAIAVEDDTPKVPAGMEGVTELEDVSAQDLRMLKPARWRLPQNPYGNTDYTAYALEWGEVKIGLAGINVGVLPRIQIGTSPVPLVLGLYNGEAKGNLLREGPLDMALIGRIWYLSSDTVRRYTDVIPESFDASVTYLGLGIRGSMRVLEPWSLHAGFHYTHLGGVGEFEVAEIPASVLPISLDETTNESLGLDLKPKLAGDMVNLRFATDVRFNRRDSIVFFFGTTVYAKGRLAVGLDIEGVDLPGEVEANLAYGGAIPVKDAWSVAGAYQASFKNLEIRLGWGYSNPQYTWLLGPLDVSWRFGGKTRNRESQVKRGWKRNKADLKEGGDAPPTEPKPEGPK